MPRFPYVTKRRNAAMRFHADFGGAARQNRVTGIGYAMIGEGKLVVPRI